MMRNTLRAGRALLVSLAALLVLAGGSPQGSGTVAASVRDDSHTPAIHRESDPAGNCRYVTPDGVDVAGARLLWFCWGMSRNLLN